MPQLETGEVLVENCVVAWDSFTKPDEGSTSHKLKLIVPPNSPDAALIEQMGQAELQGGLFRGVMPNGGHYPIKPIGAGEYGDMFAGGHIISPSTQRLPDVFNDQRQKLEPMQYARMFYQGQIVSVIIDRCFSYDNKSKGIGTGLVGVRIELSRNAPQQSLSGSGPSAVAASLFGGGAAPMQGQQQPMQQQPMQQQPMQQQPMQQQPMQQSQGQPMQGQSVPMQGHGQPMQQSQGQPMQGQYLPGQ